MVAGFLISAFGGSRLQVGGPTGAFVVVIFNVIAEHGYDGLLIATFLAGIILVGAGLMRFGQMIKFIPHTVIIGFTAGIFIALQLAFPALNIEPYYNFGRLRPLHTSGVVFAFGGNILIARNEIVDFPAGVEITNVRLLSKSGGRSGLWENPAG